MIGLVQNVERQKHSSKKFNFYLNCRIFKSCSFNDACYDLFFHFLFLLQKLAEAFDKTGTLTQGKPSITFLKSIKDSDVDLLKLLASIQSSSSHPLATAVIEEATSKNIEYTKADSVQNISGKGLKAKIGADEYILGSSKYITENIDLNEDIKKLISERQNKGETVSMLANITSKEIIGLICFSDKIKDSAIEAIKKLKEIGIESVMITGDNKGSAAAVAKILGMDNFKADILPENKAQIISELKKDNKIVAMVGDGINDAPALAAANIGIAMSTGTDVAMQTAGITLMRGDPLLIVDAISVSKATYSKIKQNLFWAFFYNVIGIPLAALGYLNPMIAGAAMALSSVSVVMNSLLLKRWKKS